MEDTALRKKNRRGPWETVQGGNGRLGRKKRRTRLQRMTEGGKKMQLDLHKTPFEGEGNGPSGGKGRTHDQKKEKERRRGFLA